MKMHLEDKKTLWVIGNGFDIASELPTKYEFFIEEYLNDVSCDDKDITIFKKMIKEDSINWADLESQLGNIAKEFSDISSIEAYLKCIADIRTKLINYLTNIDKKPNHSSIEKYFDGIDIKDTVFIVLNYTKYFERFIKQKYPNTEPTILYPHGTLENNDIILGVGAPTHIKGFTFNKLIEARLIKQNIVDYSEFFPMYSFPDRIHIFGASFGVCDGRMWAQIFNPIIFPDTFSTVKMILHFILFLLHNPIRKDEKITIYNRLDKMGDFRNNFPTYNSRFLYINKRKYVRRANKRIGEITYMDTINNQSHKIPTITYRDYKKHIKTTRPW